MKSKDDIHDFRKLTPGAATSIVPTPKVSEYCKYMPQDNMLHRSSQTDTGRRVTYHTDA
jgi:hypothetical protein